MEKEMRRKEEDAARKVEEAKKLEGIAKKEADAERKENEARIKEQDAKRKEAAARLKEEEARRKAKKLSRKEEEAKQREAQLEQDTEKTTQMRLETQKIAEDLKKKEEEARRKDIEMKERENILRWREKELMRREAEDSRREEARLEDFRCESRDQEKKRLQYESQRPDNMSLDLDPTLVDFKLMEEQFKVLQQAAFRKREDIRRTREKRKRNDSDSSDSLSTWSNPSYLSNLPRTPPSISRSPSQFNGPPIPSPARRAGPSTGGWSPPAWGLSIKPTATAASSPTASRSSSTTRKPKTGSFSSGTYPTSSSPLSASFSEAELTCKHQEFTESQQEQFRRTRKKLEAKRQLKSAGRLLSKEEMQRVFEHHERLWTRLKTLAELSWNDFPWPMVKQPSNPDDMSLSQIGAYIQSPLHPDKDKSPKDRIKEHYRRWHPDRFETKFLPKVVEDERVKVKHAAGNVARYLSDLLRKEIESNNHNIFGIFGD